MNDRDADLNAFHDFEQNGWNSTADLYDYHFGRHTMQYCPALLDAAGVGAGTRVLDLACGPGYVTAAAAARGADALGVDFAPNMVEEARRLHSGPQFAVGDAERLTCNDAEFDAVVMGFGMLHLARPESAAAEVFRVLKSGGRFAFSVWGDPATACIGGGIVFQALQNHANLDLGLPEGPPFFRFSDFDESRRLLADAGFLNIDVQPIMFSWVVDNPDAIFTAFKDAGVRAGVALRAQTDEAVEAIRKEVHDAVMRFEQDGRYAVPMGAVLTCGQKP